MKYALLINLALPFNFMQIVQKSVLICIIDKKKIEMHGSFLLIHILRETWHK